MLGIRCDVNRPISSGGLLKRFTKLFSIVAGAAIVLTVACGGAAPEPAATSAPASPTTVPAVTTAPPSGNNGGDAATRGQTLAVNNGCLACHSIDGSPSVGPSWKGLYGHEVPLSDGSTAMADDTYVRESITEPNAKVVEGFPPSVMPANFGSTLSDSDIEAITTYIKELE